MVGHGALDAPTNTAAIGTINATPITSVTPAADCRGCKVPISTGLPGSVATHVPTGVVHHPYTIGAASPTTAATVTVRHVTIPVIATRATTLETPLNCTCGAVTLARIPVPRVVRPTSIHIPLTPNSGPGVVGIPRSHGSTRSSGGTPAAPCPLEIKGKSSEETEKEPAKQ